MSGKRSRTKGHSFERWAAIKFRSVFPKACRHLEYQEGDANGVDLKNTGDYRVQCKAYKDYAPINKIREIKESGIPVLLTKGDNKTPMAVIPFEHFLHLLSKVHVED